MSKITKVITIQMSVEITYDLESNLDLYIQAKKHLLTMPPHKNITSNNGYQIRTLEKSIKIIEE